MYVRSWPGAVTSDRQLSGIPKRSQSERKRGLKAQRTLSRLWMSGDMGQQPEVPVSWAPVAGVNGGKCVG
jgi:hypothetical protein